MADISGLLTVNVGGYFGIRCILTISLIYLGGDRQPNGLFLMELLHEITAFEVFVSFFRDPDRFIPDTWGLLLDSEEQGNFRTVGGYLEGNFRSDRPPNTIAKAGFGNALSAGQTGKICGTRTAI